MEPARTMIDRADGSSRLLSLAAHELRSPLSVVQGYLKMLLGPRGGTLTDDQRHLVEQASRSCARLLDLTAELSELARLDAGTATFNMGDVALEAVVAAVCASHDGTARGVVVERSGADLSGLAVRADPERLRRTLEALLAAVVREAPDGERVLVEAQIRDKGDEQSARPTAFIQMVEARIGATMLAGGPAAREAFDESRGGFGLRLPLARRVVEAFGGRLWSPADEAHASGLMVMLPLTTWPPAPQGRS